MTGYMMIAYVTSAYARGVLVSCLINLTSLSLENLLPISILIALVGPNWTLSMHSTIQWNASYAGGIRNVRRGVQTALRLIALAAS